MQPILINAHWHCGTSCIARVFKASGMCIGNEKTKWDKNSEYNCEHYTLNTIGDCIWYGNVTNTMLKEFELVLESYVSEATRLNWKFFGIKITHALQDICWNVLGPFFDKYWPNAIYVTPIRHPLDTAKATRNSAWTVDMVVQSYRTIIPTTWMLIKRGAYILDFPNCFLDGSIERVVTSTGLDFNNEAKSVFNRANIKTIIQPHEYDKFENQYPDVVKFYNEVRTL